ncbi:MAG: alpha/beta hydrolase [Saprospiraceae bacterium]|nr:alpha/beta hydrolase [Saprospiraceae bacterium]
MAFFSMRPTLLFFLMLSGTSVQGQFETHMHVEYSSSVGDSFEIYISLPPNYQVSKTCNVVYYCDANLKSGKHLRALLATSQYNHLQNTIFVGIGHIGDYHVLRRRDFILPFIQGGDTLARDKNYGQTKRFYAYLKHELIPSIDATYKTNQQNNSIIGHSLGGLFAFFCLFQAEDMFSNYFALSPALWIDKYSIYRFNKIQGGFGQKKYLYFASGSKETFNKILNGTNDAKQFLDNMLYHNLNYDYEIWKGKTHNSAVPLALEKILKEKL